MPIDWPGIILDPKTPESAWASIFSSLLDLVRQNTSPIAIHDATVIPDRLLSEAAWELWKAYPEHAVKTSAVLKDWTLQGAGRAVLVLDALSLREMPILLNAAASRGIAPLHVGITGSECPPTTDQFAKAIGLPSRSALADNTKPGTFLLFSGDCYTDVLSIPFEDCSVPPSPNLVIWHTWLDDLIHLQKKSPEQIESQASSTLQGDGFWNFVNRLRQGRRVVITSDHGYAVCKRFSSQIEDPEAVKILRETFGASRNEPISGQLQNRFMPPIVMSHNKHHIVMGQRKWKVQSGFPDVDHGGMTLLEAAVPYVEMPAI